MDSRLALAAVLATAGVLAAGGCSRKAATTQPHETAALHPETPRPAPLFADATPANVSAVTKRIFPAVVRVDVAQERYEEGKRSLVRGIGSGVIFDAEGRILTNYHVAGRSVEIYVTLYNKERVPAKLVGDDHWTDLAIVQIDVDEVKRRGVDFSFAELGDSSTLVEGQPVMAVGTPFGLSRTTTLGVVSNTERTFYPQNQRIDEYETGEFSNWIQMDTPIAQGNSGGPLVDMDGRIVGINTRGMQGQALNFAIPINTAKQVIAAILTSARPGVLGRVERADLGVNLKPLQDLETFYDIDINRGVLVNSVDRNSPAASAGVKPQDILLSIAGQPVNVRFPEEIARTRQLIGALPIGQPVAITLRRGKETLEVSATPDKLQSAVGDERELKSWGLSVRDITRAFANQQQLDDDKGAVVTSLSGGLAADKAELEEGDVIRGVNGMPTDDLESLLARYEASVAAQEARVLLNVKRGRGSVSVVLRVTYATTNPATAPGTP